MNRMTALENDLATAKRRLEYEERRERFGACTAYSQIPNLRRQVCALTNMVENEKAPKDAAWDLAVAISSPGISTARAAQMIRDFKEAP